MLPLSNYVHYDQYVFCKKLKSKECLSPINRLESSNIKVSKSPKETDIRSRSLINGHLWETQYIFTGLVILPHYVITVNTGFDEIALFVCIEKKN